MVLYHASTINGLKVLKPQTTLSHDKYIGDYVFATSNHLLAVMYLANKGVPVMMSPDKDNPTIVICSDKDTYITNDKGGTIYELAGGDFTETPQKDLSDFEMVSSKQLEPISSKLYSTSIEAMKQYGIKIYFVGEAQFKDLIRNPKQKEIIASLNQYLKIH